MERQPQILHSVFTLTWTTIIYNNSVQPAQKLSFKTYTDCRKRMWDLRGLWNLNLPPPLKDPCTQATFVIGN
jgi:hypothetical protein